MAARIQRTDDFHSLERLHRATMPDDLMPDFGAGDWWLALDDRGPVGFAGLVASSQWWQTGYMIRAGVLPRGRGLRLHRRLIRVREAHARREGWSHMVTYTVTDNPASANNLMACGYRLYLPRLAWASDEVLYWRRRL